MLGSLEGYIKRRKKIHHSALRVFLSDHPHPQEEYLDCLWHQIKRLRTDMWIEKHIIRPYLAFDSPLCAACSTTRTAPRAPFFLANTASSAG